MGIKSLAQTQFLSAIEANEFERERERDKNVPCLLICLKKNIFLISSIRMNGMK